MDLDDNTKYLDMDIFTRHSSPPSVRATSEIIFIMKNLLVIFLFIVTVVGDETKE